MGLARESIRAMKKGVTPFEEAFKASPGKEIRSWAKGLRTLAVSKTSYLGSA